MMHRINSYIRNLFKSSRYVKRGLYKNVSVSYGLKELFEGKEKTIVKQLEVMEKQLTAMEKSINATIDSKFGEVNSKFGNIDAQFIAVNGEIKSVKFILASSLLVFFSAIIGVVSKYIFDSWASYKVIRANLDHDVIVKMQGEIEKLKKEKP